MACHSDCYLKPQRKRAVCVTQVLSEKAVSSSRVYANCKCDPRRGMTIVPVGDRFSRADLTVASLLAQFARPNELAVDHSMSGSESRAAVLDRWSKRPIMRWVRSQYEMHRAC